MEGTVRIWPGDRRSGLSAPTKHPLDLHARPQDPEWLRISDYLAPELGQPNQASSPTTDVYALGACFYEMLKGQPPFPGGGLLEKLQRHAATPFPALGNPKIPANVDRLLAYLINKDPAGRYAQAGDIPDKIQLLIPDVAFQVPVIAVPPSETAYWTAINQQQQSAEKQMVASLTGQDSSQPPRPSFQGIQTRPENSDTLEANPEPERPAETRPRRRKRRRIEQSPVFWGAIGVAAMGIILLLALNLPKNNPEQQGKGNQTAKTGGNGEKKTKTPPPKKNGSVPLPKGPVKSNPNQPETDSSPQLADDDRTGCAELPAVDLDSAPLRVRVAPVPRRALPFFVRHACLS